MRVIKLSCATNVSKYYDIITIDTDDNPTFYYKPKVDPSKIGYIILNEAIIKADNPHIIVDKNTVKIILCELDQDHIIEINGLSSDNNLVDVVIGIRYIDHEKKHIAVTLTISRWSNTI